jgi:hypothetical protein
MIITAARTSLAFGEVAEIVWAYSYGADDGRDSGG